MKKTLLICLSGLLLTQNLSAQQKKDKVEQGIFKPTDESLKQYKYPDWFRDAKFGIWSHWGPQAVPRQGDWYAKEMYVQGSEQNKYHVATYGTPSKFGYKDIIPLWKAEKWNPEQLMALYKKAGAKYFVSMGSHHDNFFLWNSKIHKWNSVNMGPHKDVVGLWQKAARKEGLRFGVSEHLAASFNWFQTSHGADKTGQFAGKSFKDIFSADKEKVSEKRNFVLVGKERHDVGRPHDAGYPIRGIFEENYLFVKNFETDRWPAGNPETGYLNVDGGPTKTACLNTVYATNNDFNYWLWSFGKRPAEELYDIKNDPACLNNLVINPTYQKKSAQLRSKLFALLKEQSDPRLLGKGSNFDRYRYADERGTNFYERYMAKDPKLSWGWVNDSDFQDISKIERAKKSRNK